MGLGEKIKQKLQGKPRIEDTRLARAEGHWKTPPREITPSYRRQEQGYGRQEYRRAAPYEGGGERVYEPPKSGVNKEYEAKYKAVSDKEQFKTWKKHYEKVHREAIERDVVEAKLVAERSGRLEHESMKALNKAKRGSVVERFLYGGTPEERLAQQKGRIKGLEEVAYRKSLVKVREEERRAQYPWGGPAYTHERGRVGTRREASPLNDFFANPLGKQSGGQVRQSVVFVQERTPHVRSRMVYSVPPVSEKEEFNPLKKFASGKIFGNND